MERTLETFFNKTSKHNKRSGSNKTKRTKKKPKEFKDNWNGYILNWLEVMKLHLEQDNLTDEIQAYTAIFSNLERADLKSGKAEIEEESDKVTKVFELFLIVSVRESKIIGNLLIDFLTT